MEPTGPLRALFVNLSQMFYCLTLLAIAGVQWRFHQDLVLPPWLAAAAGVLLAALALCLAVWNAADGLRKLAAERHWLPVGLLAGIYLAVLVLAIHAFPTLVLRQ
jgi:hypothetical protein